MWRQGCDHPGKGLSLGSKVNVSRPHSKLVFGMSPIVYENTKNLKPKSGAGECKVKDSIFLIWDSSWFITEMQRIRLEQVGGIVKTISVHWCF